MFFVPPPTFCFCLLLCMQRNIAPGYPLYVCMNMFRLHLPFHAVCLEGLLPFETLYLGHLSLLLASSNGLRCQNRACQVSPVRPSSSPRCPLKIDGRNNHIFQQQHLMCSWMLESRDLLMRLIAKEIYIAGQLFCSNYEVYKSSLHSRYCLLWLLLQRWQLLCYQYSLNGKHCLFNSSFVAEPIVYQMPWLWFFSFSDWVLFIESAFVLPNQNSMIFRSVVGQGLSSPNS